MEERRRAIAELVNKMGSVSIAQLKEAFPEVSEMTIRNDIKALDREHKLVRVYGGVRSLEFAVGADGLFDVRRNQNVDAKAAIAAKAAKLVRPNTTIYLDSGSTLAKFAAALPDEHLMVFTCGIYNVMELGHFDTVDVIVPGGTLNRYNMCLHGSRAIREIRKLRFDQVFIGAASYSKTAPTRKPSLSAHASSRQSRRYCCSIQPNWAKSRRLPSAISTSLTSSSPMATCPPIFSSVAPPRASTSYNAAATPKPNSNAKKKRRHRCDAASLS